MHSSLLIICIFKHLLLVYQINELTFKLWKISQLKSKILIYLMEAQYYTFLLDAQILILSLNLLLKWQLQLFHFLSILNLLTRNHELFFNYQFKKFIDSYFLKNLLPNLKYSQLSKLNLLLFFQIKINLLCFNYLYFINNFKLDLNTICI